MLNTESFIKKAKKIHGDKYDYSKVDYKNNRTKVCIICPTHGEFWQRPSKHLIGQGCPICSGNKKMTTEEFISRAKEVHGDKYDYSKTVCDGTHNKTTIICPIHGEFEQMPKEHLVGKGCNLCSNVSKRNKLKYEDNVVIEKIKKEHGNKYIIPKDFSYVNKWTKIHLICPKHGDFYSAPFSVWKGCGCPKCSHNISRAEDEIYSFLLTFLRKEDIIRNCRDILPSKHELDLYVPHLKIAIEFNGIRWHSEEFGKDRNYHLNKLKECNENGINLIMIFEDEWIERKYVVLDKIRHIMGFNPLDKVFARKCQIKPIDDKEMAKKFLESNHIQGYVSSTIHIGGYYNDKLIAVMSFIREKEDYWNLSRFATDNSIRCIGLASKMFSFFVKEYNPIFVKSFADRRWTVNGDNNLYTKLGFELAETLAPDYRYVNGQKRDHKFAYRKKKLSNKYGVPLEWTEYQMTQYLGFYRIWDCGLFRYEWKKNN